MDKKRDNWRHKTKGGAKSYGSVNRDNKQIKHRTDVPSPEYNIYSDSDASPGEADASAQKEGGSPEQSLEGRVQANNTAITICVTGGMAAGNRPRQSISANRLAQNGGKIVH